MLSKQKIGERLKKLREERHEKQTDIAKLLNVQRQIISYYETGARMPNVEDLAILAEHFNTSVDYLLGISDIESPNAELQAVCKYTGLSEGAIKYLNEMNNEATDGSNAFENYFQINEEYKKGIILKIELLDFFLRSDEVDFYITLGSGAKYREELKEWINRVNMFFDKVNTLDNVDEDTAKELFDIRTKLLEEEYKAVRYNYFESVEFFKDSLNEYAEDLTGISEKLLFRLMRFSPFELLKEGDTDGEHN